MTKRLIYVGDPMCSWCWGFSPVQQALVRACADRAEPKLVVGGLRPFTTEPNDEKRKQFLREHWVDIGERTGQPFKLDLTERDDFVYDTEPACRAAVTAREMAGEEKALSVFADLQYAFYAENQDVTQSATLAGIAAKAGFDKEEFAARLDSEEMKAATLADFQFARSLGVTGFPTVVVNEGETYAYLTVGYQPLERLEGIFLHWLEHGFPRQEETASTVH